MKKLKAIGLLVFMVPVLFGCQSDTSVIQAEKIITHNEERFRNEPLSGSVIDGVRVIEVKAFQFFFEPEVIVVNKDERIRLLVSAEDVPHGFEIEGFEIPGYDINTKIRPGLPLTLEFTADEIGIWEFICTIYCGFGHSTMRGMFVVLG